MTKTRFLVVGAVFAYLFGLLMRFYLLRTSVGALNADEAYTGLQAM